MCKYKRIVLKISGEALSGSTGHGINSEIVNRISGVIKRINQMGVEVAIVVGAEISGGVPVPGIWTEQHLIIWECLEQ